MASRSSACDCFTVDEADFLTRTYAAVPLGAPRRARAQIGNRRGGGDRASFGFGRRDTKEITGYLAGMDSAALATRFAW
jgi:hypothetical protein